MRLPNKACATAALLALLAGCSSVATTPVLQTGSYPPNVGAGVPSAQARGGKTVMLVTISGTNDAVIAAYPSGKVLHTLTGLSEPQGACSGGAGHFWIADTSDSNVLEYSTNGMLLATLADPNDYPVGCAYDPKSGDLAVTNVITTGDGPGNVAIYAKAKGSPKIYSTPSLQKIYFGAYDGSSGTLVVDGESSSSAFTLASLTNGTFKTITLEGTIVAFPSSVAWSTKIRSMNVGDQEAAKIYHFELSGKVTGTTSLGGSAGAGDIVSFVIFGSTVLAPTMQGIGVFPYPAGGKPSRVITVSGANEPSGIAVSSAVTE